MPAIDPDDVLSLARMGGSAEEIAAALDCPLEALKQQHASLIDRGHHLFRLRLRKQILDAAESGNVSLLNNLMKHWLTQPAEQDANPPQEPWKTYVGIDLDRV